MCERIIVSRYTICDMKYNMNTCNIEHQDTSVVLKSVSKSFNIGYKKHENALYRMVKSISGRENKKILKVLHGIDLVAHKGEKIGIVGRNGSGKSTLLRLIAGIYEQDEGSVYTSGTLLYVSGFSQGLKTKLTMGENIYLVGALMGLSSKEVSCVFDKIVKFSELENFIDTKVYQFSSGMITRLTFSIFIHCIHQKCPDILLLDEVIGVGGDLDFTKKANDKMKELILGDSTVFFVSHNLVEIENYCPKTIWIENGSVSMLGSTKEVVEVYRNSKVAKI